MSATLGSPRSEDASDQRHFATDPRFDEGWRLWLPDGLDTGVHAETPGQPSGLRHAGENWTKPSLCIQPHVHDTWELYLQLHGTSRWLVGDRVLGLAPGWVVAVPPAVVHGHDPAAGRQRRHHYAYAGFDAGAVGRRVPELGAVWRGGKVLVSAQGWSLPPAFRALVREIAHDRPLGDLALPAALDLLLVEAVRVLHSPGDVAPRMPKHPAVARAKALLDEDLARSWTLTALAAAVGLSRAHLSELFAAEVGQPPYTYLLERRVERAAHLLAVTSRGVGEIAADVGFASGSSLARVFRSVHGIPPARWRRDAQA